MEGQTLIDQSGKICPKKDDWDGMNATRDKLVKEWSSHSSKLRSYTKQTSDELCRSEAQGVWRARTGDASSIQISDSRYQMAKSMLCGKTDVWDLYAVETIALFYELAASAPKEGLQWKIFRLFHDEHLDDWNEKKLGLSTEWSIIVPILCENMHACVHARI